MSKKVQNIAESERQRQADEAYQQARPDDDEQQSIKVGPDVARMIDQLLYQLSSVEPPPVFQAGGQLVRVTTITERCRPTKDKPKKTHTHTKIVNPFCHHSLPEVLARSGITFQRFHGSLKKWIFCEPPTNFIRASLTKGEWNSVPCLQGIIGAPVMRSDGSILSEQGYDASTGLYLYDDDHISWRIPKRPNKAKAEQALANIRKTFSTLPYAEEADEAVFLAALLTPFIRHLVDNVPLFAVSAASSATGKSLLCDMPYILFNGQRPPATALPKSQEELNKLFYSAVLAKRSIMVFDNVDHPVESDALCAYLTSAGSLDARKLGGHELANARADMTIFMNGNNLQILGDLANRSVSCNLDAGVERPEERSFTFSLRERVFEQRQSLVEDLLTILLAWYQTGRPVVDQLSNFGRFERWSAYVRAPLVWLGMDDPVTTRRRLLSNDPYTERLEAVLTSWHACYGIEPQTAGDVIRDLGDGQEIIPRKQDLLDSILDIAGYNGRIDSRKLGRWLLSNEGRPLQGLVVRRCGKRSGAVRWVVGSVDGE